MKIIEKIVDVSTGEEQIIERDMTAQEVDKYEATQLRIQRELEAEAQAQAKRQAVLDRLGITEEEARLLLA